MGEFTFGTMAGAPITGSLVGWQNYSDTATESTPVSLSGTPIALPNDGLGSTTLKTFGVVGHGDIWNPSTGSFDFSSLKAGDTVDFRVDFTVTTDGPNHEISTDIELAIGQAFPYTLTLDRRAFKSAGTFEFTRWSSVYMGDDNTLNGDAHFSMMSDGSGDTVVVNGWYVRTHVR